MIVGDYFAMLALELAGKPFIKSQRNSALHDLTGRSRGAIEFKHQNISAVLQRLGRPWVFGYKPMRNFQKALIDGVDKHLSAIGDIAAPPALALASRVEEAGALFLGPPPALGPASGEEPEALTRLARKFDPATRDARNRVLGKQGEERVLDHERYRLRAEDRPDLAAKIRWVSEVDGDGAGYDILSFDRMGGERLIEVKTTSGDCATPFFISENERSLSAERPDAFRLFRLYDFFRAPKGFEIVPPLESAVYLSPANYRAHFSR